MGYMDETERQVLVKIFEKHGEEVEVTGLEYWDDDGNEQRWKVCMSQFLLFVCSLFLDRSFEFARHISLQIYNFDLLKGNTRRADFGR
jgi:hypothetical protein